MRKRVFFLVLAGMLAVTVSGFAQTGGDGVTQTGRDGFAIGAQLTSINFVSVGAMMTFHVPKVPLLVAVGGSFTSGVSLSTAIDYWLLNPQIIGVLSYYAGFGGYGAITLDDPASYAVGLRMPLGLQWWPLRGDLLEVFAEVAPAWVPLTSGGLMPTNFQAQVALGFRIWP